MNEIAILSGKGGTGKTSLTAAFAYMAQNSIICDADVDASDLHLLLNPRIKEKRDFMGGSLAEINLTRCNQCQLCRKLCRFNAISDSYHIDGISCEGCGVCVDLCPEQAITFHKKKCGDWYISSTRFGPMIHARLGIGEENSGKLVHTIRKKAREIAMNNGHSLILTDGPPGIGCPVIASISGVSAIVIIVEPTLSGLHDMERVVELGQRFNVPLLVCINKYDINPEISQKIENKIEELELILLNRIPFDPSFTKAMVQGQNILEYCGHGETAKTIRNIWEKISSTLSQENISKQEIQIL